MPVRCPCTVRELFLTLLVLSLLLLFKVPSYLVNVFDVEHFDILTAKPISPALILYDNEVHDGLMLSCALHIYLESIIVYTIIGFIFRENERAADFFSMQGSNSSSPWAFKVLLSVACSPSLKNGNILLVAK